MNKKKKSQNKKTDEDDVFWISPDRLVALTDGVFAITMTILVLELDPFHIMERFRETGWIEIYAYFIGFLSLGVYWTLHHYMFHFIKRSNGAFVWWNILFLAVSALVPFWTKILVMPSDIELIILAPFLYGMYMIFTFLILYIMWMYATSSNYLVGRDFNPRKIKPFSKTLLYGSFMVGIVSSLTVFIPLIGWLLLVIGGYFVYVTVHGPHKVFKE